MKPKEITKQNGAAYLINEFLLKKYPYLDSIICSLNISSQNASRVTNSQKLSAKKHNLKVYAN